MKKSLIILLLLAVVGTFAGIYSFRQSDILLQMQLETAYQRLIDASRAGDEKALQDALGSVTFSRVYNEEVARFGRLRKQRIQLITASTPDMKQYAFFGILKDGRRAILSYRPKNGSDDHRGALLLRSFLYENGGWRVERQDFLPAGRWLEGKPFRETVRQPSYPQSLKVDRPLEDAPPLIEPPEIPAELFVRSTGYETTVRINDREVARVRDQTLRMYIPGGLRETPNTIRIDTALIADSAAVLKEVNVVVNVFDAMGRGHTTFQYAPYEVNPASYEAVIRTDR